jgi:hypothetical protein
MGDNGTLQKKIILMVLVVVMVVVVLVMLVCMFTAPFAPALVIPMNPAAMIEMAGYKHPFVSVLPVAPTLVIRSIANID